MPTFPQTGSGCHKSVCKKKTQALVQISLFFFFRSLLFWEEINCPPTFFLGASLLSTPPHQELEKYSHCLQERVAHEGLLWDSLDVVVVETPRRQHQGAVRFEERWGEEECGASWGFLTVD